MNANDARGGARRVSAATYIGAAVIAAVAGFVAVYVSLWWDGNVAEPQPQPSAPVATQETAPAPAPSAASGPLAGLNKGPVAAFVVHAEPHDVPSFTFTAGDGAETSLEPWKGKVVLVNLWATWCGPCRKEMPSLDRLKSKLGGADFDVVAIATDRGDMEKPRVFLQEIGAETLKLYHDPTGKLPANLKAFGMPTTLLIDRNGKEIGRLVGPAEWDSLEAVALIEAAIAAPAGGQG